MQNNIENKSKQDLLEIARKLKIKGRSLMNKDKLIRLIDKALISLPRKEQNNILGELHEGFKSEANKSNGKAESSVAAISSSAIPTSVNEQQYFQAPPSDLPVGYGDNKIVLMAIDPAFAYTYWEIRSSVAEAIIAKHKLKQNEIELLLRVYDITDLTFNGSNAWRIIDFGVGYANNWYVRLGEANRSYVAEIGFLTKDGRFFAIARSNTIHTPRDTVSDLVDQEWMVVDEKFEKIYSLSGGYKVIREGSGEFAQWQKKKIVQFRLNLGMNLSSETTIRKWEVNTALNLSSESASAIAAKGKKK